ncbi:hypothetical protein [Duganella sp. CF458]|uniref:hypothetical protein n=1 Tax=Duganella sp. CF458 TaxID=1884368 RepID=UPI000B81C4F6|nr:hypothetical protein [Duganella sp. CF458]
MSENKYDQAVFKIFEMTHNGELAWSKETAPETLVKGTESQYPAFYETEYQGRRLALYRERYYHLPGLGVTAVMSFSALTGRDERPGWRERAVLALLDDGGDVVFEFPASRQTKHLLDAVCHKTSDVDQFVNGLLSTTEPSKA